MANHYGQAPLGNLPALIHGGAQNDDAQKDSENDVWRMYLDEVKEEDKRIADAWKEDANGILVFTGLFAATVGAFIIEFYKKLSPDSGTANQPSSPSASMIWVNALWLISLELSLTSALIATLLQQWAREYVETPGKSSIDSKKRARIRSILFRGTELYKISLLVEILPTLLHLSVFLFFGGLMITFHTINKKVAIAVDASAGFFGLAYLTLTILPCIDIRCPFRTPMTKILWYPWHTFLFLGALCLQWIGQYMLNIYSQTLENFTENHGRYLKDGLGKSIDKHASTLKDEDQRIFIRLFRLLALADRDKFLEFAASIPRHGVVNIIPESGEIPLRDPLLTLLRSSAAGTGPTGPDAGVRKRSLLVCLDAIHRIATRTLSIPDLQFVRDNFANLDLMRALWDDSNTTIRVISRSICALVAKQVMRELHDESGQRWLHGVTRVAANTILSASVATRNRMNFQSFLYGVLSDQADDFPTESFKETVAILLDLRTDQGTDVHFCMDASRNRLSEEVRQLQQSDAPPGSHAVVLRLCSESMFPFLFPPFPIHNQPGP